MAKKSTVQTPNQLIPFAPHIEAKRPFYNQIAESLIHLVTSGYETDVLDITPNDAFVPEPGTQSILMNALEKHMDLLFAELLMLEPCSIRRFYAEMRMHIEQIRWETKQAYLKTLPKTDSPSLPNAELVKRGVN